METDVADLAFDKVDGVRTRATALMIAQITTGVTDSLDVQLGIEGWLEQRVSGPGVDERTGGRGEVYFRAKWNFWKGEKAAWGVLPYYKFRGTAAKSVRPAVAQYGVIVPCSYLINDRWQFSGHAEADWLDNGAGGHDCWWSGYATFQCTLSPEWCCYWETTSAAIDGRGAWATQTGVGVIWQATESFAWDAALYAGVTDAAPDWSPALRFVWSF